MKNIFEVGTEEKNRIRRLHENKLFSHGTSLMVIKEQTTTNINGEDHPLVEYTDDATLKKDSEVLIAAAYTLGEIPSDDKEYEIKVLENEEYNYDIFYRIKGFEEKKKAMVPADGEDKETFLTRCTGDISHTITCEAIWLKANPKQVPGCTDAMATNYNPLANVDDNSCEEGQGDDTNDGKYQDPKLIAKWNKEARDVYNNSLYKIGAGGLNVFSDESARDDLKIKRSGWNPMKYIKGDGFITQLTMLSTKPFPIKDKNSGEYKGIKIPVSDIRSQKKPKNRRQKKNYKRYCQPKYIKAYFDSDLEDEAAIYFDCAEKENNKLFIDPESFMVPLKKLGVLYTKIFKERDKLPPVGN